MYIYVASHHSAAERTASIRILHLTLFLTSILISIHVYLTLLTLSSTILRHVLLGHPLPCFPWGFHSRAYLAISSDGFRSEWPKQPPPHLRFPICKSVLGCFVRFRNSSFLIWSGQKILSIFLTHLLIKICSLAVIHFESFQVSQP